MKKTKESYVRENAILTVDVERLEREDHKVRAILCELLGSKEYKTYQNMPSVKVLDWLGIFFLLGELKGDAHFSNLLTAAENARMENEVLKQEIRNLKNPPKE